MKKFLLIIGLTLGACTLFYAADADNDQEEDGILTRIEKEFKLKKSKSKPASKTSSKATPAARKSMATIDTVSGSSRVLRLGESEFAPLGDGDELFVGDVVVTGEDGEAAMTDTTQNKRRMTISVSGNSIMVITRQYTDDQNEQRYFRLLQGGGNVEVVSPSSGQTVAGQKKKKYNVNAAIELSDR